jgi:ubiquinone/menaquinone biosynthesis C-methylase UbiE
VKDTIDTANEQAVEKAFSKQSAVFDELYSSNTIVQYKRQRVRDHVQQFLKPDSNILELNAGTGEDATWFAQHGYTVHATDISKEMQAKLVEKVKKNDLGSKVTNEICSFT